MSVEEMKEIRNNVGEIFPITSKGESISVAAKVRESLEVRTFIEMALEDNNVLSLLCNHRSILSAFEKFNFPLLFSVIRSIKGKADLPFALVATKESTKAQHTIERIVEKAKPTAERLLEKFTKKYGTLLQNIDAKGESLVVQEEREQQILGMIVSQIIIQDLFNEEKILKIIKMFEDFVIDDVVPVGLMFVESLKKEFIDFGIKNRKKMIHASKLDERIYEDIINRLETNYKVIKPLISIFWCENEKHEHYSFFMFNHSTLPMIKCPICNKNLSVGSFYYFIPSINYLLRHKEGLIPALTMYIIEKTGQEWSSSVFLQGTSDDTEKDIVLKKENNRYSLFEIKSFATDVTPRIKKEHIKQLMQQALEHLNSYLKRSIAVDDFYLVSNYSVDVEMEQFVEELLLQKKYAELKKVKLKLIGPNNIKKVVEKVKQQ